jgi:hypothetical protein
MQGRGNCAKIGGNWKELEYLEVLGADGRIILK